MIDNFKKHRKMNPIENLLKKQKAIP